MAKDTNEIPGVSLDPVKPPTVGAHEESIKRGYELDPINAKPFIQFTVIMLILFACVWILCFYVFDMTAEKWTPDGNKNVRTKYEGKLNPLAKEFNDRSPEERIARIDNFEPKVAKSGRDSERVYAPRLEAFKTYDFGGMPEYVRSSATESKAAANPTHYHPEDIRPVKPPGMNAKLKDVLKSSKSKSEGYDATNYAPSNVVIPRAKASNGGWIELPAVSGDVKHPEDNKKSDGKH